MIDALLSLPYAVWSWLVSLQRDVSAEMAGALLRFVAERDWGELLAFAPLGVLFGAAHALTPGHSKALLATFVVGSGAGVARATGTALILAATHVAVSVLIVLLALPLVSMAVGEAGRSELLERASRGLLGLVELWLVVSAVRGGRAHGHGEGPAFGVLAGLIPCPLTLLVMTVASARGAPEAGVVFAAMMLVGVAAVLAAVAAGAALARAGAAARLERGRARLDAASRALTGATGLVLLAVAAERLAAAPAG
jgi:ABC-type nickel/cobalt efflux system permease component RcnA